MTLAFKFVQTATSSQVAGLAFALITIAQVDGLASVSVLLPNPISSESAQLGLPVGSLPVRLGIGARVRPAQIGLGWSKRLYAKRIKCRCKCE
jgi:hypothetical protein